MVRRFDVEIAGRLVGEHERRLMDHRTRNRGSLLLAAGYLLRKSRGPVLEPELTQQLQASSAGVVPLHAVQRERQLDVLGDRECRN